MRTPETAGCVVLRTMRVKDVDAVLDIQEPGAVAGLAQVFPQDRHPFPRSAVAERWLAEITSPDVECFVVLQDGALAGFAAVRGDELLHFGVALQRWGSGIALTAHDLLLEHLRSNGHRRAWLQVFTDNRRGRRFYERCGWHATGERGRSTFPPYPELLRYERDLTDGH